VDTVSQSDHTPILTKLMKFDVEVNGATEFRKSTKMDELKAQSLSVKTSKEEDEREKPI
jgi:hypothetical protein